MEPHNGERERAIFQGWRRSHFWCGSQGRCWLHGGQCPWGLAGLGRGWGLKVSSRASGFVGCLFLSPWPEWGMGKVPSLPGLCSSCRDRSGGGMGSWEGPMKERVVGAPQIPSMLKSLGRGGGVFPQLLGKPWGILGEGRSQAPSLPVYLTPPCPTEGGTPPRPLSGLRKITFCF